MGPKPAGEGWGLLVVTSLVVYRQTDKTENFTFLRRKLVSGWHILKSLVNVTIVRIKIFSKNLV